MKIINVAHFQNEALDRRIFVHVINSSQCDVTRLHDVLIGLLSISSLILSMFIMNKCCICN